MEQRSSTLIWLIWTAVYFVYTRVRGSLTGIYAYHFLDPRRCRLPAGFHHGYGLIRRLSRSGTCRHRLDSPIPPQITYP